MKVKATIDFRSDRNASLKLPKDDFRKLQAGKVVDVPKNKIDEHPNIYTIIDKSEEVK
jgi:exosome complex RNA-binding protein Rrp4